MRAIRLALPRTIAVEQELDALTDEELAASAVAFDVGPPPHRRLLEELLEVAESTQHGVP